MTVSGLRVSPREDDTGGEVSFESIFEAEFDYVWNSLYRLGVHERDLEDLTHDVFLDLHRKLPEYDRARPIHPWLFAFAFRAASEYRRRGQNRYEIVGEWGRVDQAPLADEQLALKEELALVRSALDKIELDRRSVFVAHDIDGCSIPDIAATLGIPVNTAYSRLRLARHEFEDAVNRLRARRGDR